MSEDSFLHRHWKLLLNVVTISALLILIIAIHKQLGATIRNLAHVNAWALALLIPVEALNYHAQTRLYQRLFGLVGNRLSYKYLFGAALELNFVNHVFPSAGVTGISYFSMRLRKGSEISGAKATLIQAMKLALTYLSFEVLIVFGLLCLAVVGKANDLTILVAAVISTLLVVLTFVFAYIVGSKQRINTFFTAATRVINRMIHLIWRHNPEPINVARAKEVFNDFHDNYHLLTSRWRELRMPFWYAFLANLTEVLAVYVVYLAFGEVVNVGAVILAYAVANIAGVVSVLPGGVGVYEALMTAVLATAGVPARVSLPVTIMYRVVNTLIQVPPGYVLYHRALNRGEQVPRPDNAA